MTSHRCGSAIILVVTALLAVACARESPEPKAGGACAPSNSQMNVHVASYDLAVGGPSRFIVGLVTSDDRLISFGSVSVRFAFCGTKAKPLQGRYGSVSNAAFLQLPEEAGNPVQPPPTSAPIAAPASRGRGVFAAQAGFDKAGFWRVEVTAEVVDQGRLEGVADFEVLAKHQIPAPGDTALPTENLTLDSPDAPREAIDSRASTDEGIPDTELHQTTIARAIREGKPALVVFSTPVFCQSRFCGPVTDMVAGLARDHKDRAAFIHVEIWRDFNGKALNKAAADWLFRNDNLTEPWVFLIGADGKIAARWDNVATRGEIEPLLTRLPAR